MSIRYGSSSYAGEVDYDPEIIQRFADKMYSQANAVICLYTLVLTVIGGATGYAIAPDTHRVPAAAGAAVVGAILGYVAAQPRAFQLRLQAQTALCQMKIEANTRRQHEHARPV